MSKKFFHSKKEIKEKNCDEFDEETKIFFEQFEEPVRDTLMSLFDANDNPKKEIFICVSCRISFPGSMIKDGHCPNCHGAEMLPKDFAV